MLSSSNGSVRSRLEAVDPELAEFLRATLQRLEEFDPSIEHFWRTAGIDAKIETYLLRYVAVLYEMCAVEGKNPALTIEALAVQLLSCAFWRLFDNCVDQHTELAHAHCDSLISYSHLQSFTQSAGYTQANTALERHLRCMTAASHEEATAPLPFDRIWERCSVFVFAAETIANLSPVSISHFKDYINYSGLAHDAHDLYSDLKSGTKSLPVSWIQDLDEDQVFSELSVERLYNRIRHEVSGLQGKWADSDFIKKYPLMWTLLEDSHSAFRRR